MPSFFPFFVGKEMRVFVAQMIETIRVEGRARALCCRLATTAPIIRLARTLFEDD
jgi:hypothetical protein